MPKSVKLTCWENHSSRNSEDMKTFPAVQVNLSCRSGKRPLTDHEKNFLSPCSGVSRHGTAPGKILCLELETSQGLEAIFFLPARAVLSNGDADRNLMLPPRERLLGLVFSAHGVGR